MKGRSLHIENNKSPTDIPEKITHFVKVSKKVILENSLPEHRISILLYFLYNQTWDEMVHYSPIYMIRWSGYKPNWHRGTSENIYTKFRDCMQWYFKNGYLLNFDKDIFVQNTFQSSLLNKKEIVPTENFGIIYDFEIERIMKYKSNYRPLNKSILLLLLSYIRAFTWNRTNQFTGHSEKSKKNKPEIFHSQFKTIAQFTGNTEKMISKATSVLEELGLIMTYRMPRYKDTNGNWNTDDIIYVCPYKFESSKNNIIKRNTDQYDYKKELENGIVFLREQKYISRKFYQE